MYPVARLTCSRNVIAQFQRPAVSAMWANQVKMLSFNWEVFFKAWNVILLIGQQSLDHYLCQERHWLRCQVHRCRSCHRWSRRIRSWYRLCLWFPHHWIRPQPFPQATALFLCHFGICFVWGYGTLLFDDGLFAPVRFLNIRNTRRPTNRTIYYLDLWPHANFI